MLDRLVTREISPEQDWFFFKLPQAISEELRPQVRELSIESAQLVWNELIKRNQYKKQTNFLNIIGLGIPNMLGRIGNLFGTGGFEEK